MARRFSCRNDSNDLVCFGMDHQKESLLEETDGQVPWLGILESLVVDRYRETVEERLEVGKVDSMFYEVRSPLSLVPLDFHGLSVTTRRNHVNGLRS